MALNVFAVSVKGEVNLASLWFHPTNTHPAKPSPQDEKENKVFSVVLSVYIRSIHQTLGTFLPHSDQPDAQGDCIKS